MHFRTSIQVYNRPSFNVTLNEIETVVRSLKERPRSCIGIDLENEPGVICSDLRKRVEMYGLGQLVALKTAGRLSLRAFASSRTDEFLLMRPVPTAALRAERRSTKKFTTGNVVEGFPMRAEAHDFGLRIRRPALANLPRTKPRELLSDLPEQDLNDAHISVGFQ